MAMGGWKETGWRRGRHTSVAQNSSSHDSDLRIIFADAERLLSLFATHTISPLFPLYFTQILLYIHFFHFKVTAIE